MYMNINTLQYPISESEIKRLHPNTSFPIPFTPPDGYVWVFPTPEPSYNKITQIIRRITPILTVKGHWEESWEVVPRFEEYTDDNGVTHTVQEQEIAAFEAENAILIKNIVTSTQFRLDVFAQTRGYDDIKSASSYAGCSVQKFNIEGTYCRDVRAQTWETLYNILDEVKNDIRQPPTSYNDIEPLLPNLVWPN